MLRVSWFVAALCGLAVLPSFVDSAQMQSRPERPVWVADETTEYRLFVWVDNSGLGGEPTDGVQWRLAAPSVFTYVPGSSARPAVDDFFGGLPMFFEAFDPPRALSFRLIQEIGGGPIGSQGNVGEYKFVVAATAKSGMYIFPFSLASNYLVSPDNEVQPSTIRAVPVRVVQNHNEGIVTCMSGPNNAYPSRLACDYYDFDDDGDVDLQDWSAFQATGLDAIP